MNNETFHNVLLYSNNGNEQKIFVAIVRLTLLQTDQFRYFGDHFLIQTLQIVPWSKQRTTRSYIRLVISIAGSFLSKLLEVKLALRKTFAN